LKTVYCPRDRVSVYLRCACIVNGIRHGICDSSRGHAASSCSGCTVCQTGAGSRRAGTTPSAPQAPMVRVRPPPGRRRRSGCGRSRGRRTVLWTGVRPHDHGGRPRRGYLLAVPRLAQGRDVLQTGRGCGCGRRQLGTRSRGSVTVPGFAIPRRVASARYAAGSTPASFADSMSV